ncbi:MAG TPA: antibiotic biosynthesis monooxygenase family protein [Massilibacterium sp.]|nr:antibiotic biosynthesis monooxygenase family protein [Massilibacterium sp.]
MYVVMNELYLPNKEAKDMMIQRFRNSAENMKAVQGCIEFMFLNHENEEGKQIVFTKWESKKDYEAWVESEAFKRAHSSSSQDEKQKEQKQKSGASNQLHAYEVIYHT